MNGLKVKGKSVHDICDTLCQMTGTLTFVIVPGPGPQKSGGAITGGAKSNNPTTVATLPNTTTTSQPKEPPKDEIPEIVVILSNEFRFLSKLCTSFIDFTSSTITGPTFLTIRTTICTFLVMNLEFHFNVVISFT